MRFFKRKRSNVVKFVLGERSNETKIKSLKRFKASNLLNFFKRKKKPQAAQIVYKFGYSKSTIYRYEKRGIDLPEYYYTSGLVFLDPEGVEKSEIKDSEIKKKSGDLSPKKLMTRVADNVSEHANHLSTELGYELLFNLREVYIKFMY